jgi:anti-sigma factor RsiW
MMTVHPARAVLLAHADGELTNLEDRKVARHVETCAECDSTVAELRVGSTIFSSVLNVLDGAEPAHWSRDGEETSRYAARNDADVLPLRAPGRFDEMNSAPARFPERSDPQTTSSGRHTIARFPSGALRWAAGILLLAGATVSAAIVGSNMLSNTPAATETVAEPASVAATVAAVMVTPVGGEIRLVISGAGSDSRLLVTFADRADASVAVESAAAPRFRAEEGRVDLALDGAAAVVRLTLPTSLRTATVTADGAVIATVRDAQVQPAAAARAGIPLRSDIEPDPPRME